MRNTRRYGGLYRSYGNWCLSLYPGLAGTALQPRMCRKKEHAAGRYAADRAVHPASAGPFDTIPQKKITPRSGCLWKCCATRKPMMMLYPEKAGASRTTVENGTMGGRSLLDAEGKICTWSTAGTSPEYATCPCCHVYLNPLGEVDLVRRSGGGVWNAGGFAAESPSGWLVLFRAPSSLRRSHWPQGLATPVTLRQGP